MVLDEYDPLTDDCPVIYDNHEAPSEHRTLFGSLRRYLELLTTELSSCDSYDGEDSEAFLARMKLRGTEELLVIF
jgi:hypothetical protein